MAALATTLAVLSLATAIKDVLEFATNIRDAFKKVPQNYRNARELSEDVLEFARDIKMLYEEERDVFERKPRFKKSLEELLHAMNNVQRQCVQLVPPAAEKKRDKFKIAFYAFWNREKVTNLVAELKSRIYRCYNQFLVASNVRIEANVDRISMSVQSLSTSIMTSTRSSQLFQFVGSHSQPMTWMRGTIPDHELPKHYTRWQLGISKDLLETCMSKWFQNPPLSLAVDSIPAFTWKLHKHALAHMEYHDQLVKELALFRKMITRAKSEDIADVIQQGATIASRLSNCEMDEEAATVREWVTATWREITTMFPSYQAKCYLAEYLRESAICLGNIGKYDEAHARIREGMGIAHSLSLQNSSSARLLDIMADNVSTQAWFARKITGTGSSTELASRAVDLAKQSLISVLFPTASRENDLQSVSTFLDLIDEVDRSNSDDETDLSTLLYGLADSLEELACTQKSKEALRTQNHALEILHRLGRRYSNSRLILHSTASLLEKMRSNKNASNQDRLDYAMECVSVYRQLFQASQSPRYILPMSRALLSYRRLLLSSGQRNKCEEVLQEITSLAEVASQKYFMISIPSKTQGDYYFHVAEVHKDMGRLYDAIHTAQNASAQYSGLHFIGDKDFNLLKYVRVLVLLCRLYYDTAQYPPALLEGRKVFNLMITEIGKAGSDIAIRAYTGPLTEIVDIFENLSRGPIPGTLMTSTPSLNNFQSLFELEMSSSLQVLDLYARILLERPLTAYQNNRHHDITHAINLLQHHTHISSMQILSKDLTFMYIDILHSSARFQEALRLCHDMATTFSIDEHSMDYNRLLDATFWSEIYTHFPDHAIQSINAKLSRHAAQPPSTYLEDLATALFDAGKVEDALSCILDARSKKIKKYRYCRYTWLASQLFFASNNLSQSRYMFDEVVSRGHSVKYTPSIPLNPIGDLIDLGHILFAGLIFCCSGEHEDGLKTLKIFSDAISAQICVSGAYNVRLALDLEQKRGKWKLIGASARANLQCDHMEQVVNGEWTAMSGLL